MITVPPPIQRLTLAIQRVEAALDQADFDGCGHIITSDNVKLSDVRLLLNMAKLYRNQRT